ncbi:phage portal protein [Microbispora sp. NPDC049125]|uniref:phage portal protein n=1 Tax=Microbispora sp. NPDC049125 TaxID=3154929 RepID=UPI003465A22D
MQIRDAVKRLWPANRGAAAGPRDASKVVLADYYAALSAAGVYSGYRARPWPVERAVSEAYERIIYVHKAVEAIAGHSSQLTFELKQDGDLVDDHPLLRVLNKRANPLETGRQFRKRLASQILLSKKGAFVEVTRSRGGDIVRMDLLPPGRMKIIPGNGDQLISHYELTQSDGTTRRIDPENVRWFREPHPLDPFSGVTPLEAAGLSVELDFYARLYNVAFLRNDARPGGVIAIGGELDESDMDRIEDKFGKGPTEAGKLTVIAGDVSYVDLATRPRDMAYEAMAKSARNEILTAFGVPESLLGHAAERTFDNADAELYAYWTITMPPFLNLLLTGFDEDSDDDLEGTFDLSHVEVLQRAAIARRDEARKEYELGLISINEYRELSGREPFDMPRARSLWVTSGKQLVPTSDKDAKALDEEAMKKFEEAQRLAPPVGTTAQQQQIGNGNRPVPPGRPDLPGGRNPKPLPPGASAGRSPAGQKALAALPGGGQAAPVARPVMKLIRTGDSKAAAVESAPDEAARARLEVALAAALAGLGVRLVERSAARLASPKARKGTRHWVARYEVDTGVGTKQLDAVVAVDADRWASEAEDAARPLVEAAAVTAAAALAAELAPESPTPVLDTLIGAGAVATTVQEVVAMVGNAARRHASAIAERVAAADADGVDIDTLVLTARSEAGRIPAWSENVATQAATAAISGARDAAADAITVVNPGKFIDRTWRTRGDATVRHSHKGAAGQIRPVGESFDVGAALLRYPGDPLGPPGETRNCRCWLVHRARATGQFVPAPPGSVVRADQRAS